MGQERQTQLPRSHDLSLCLTLSNRTNARKPYFGDLTPDSRCSTAMLRALIVGSSSPSSLTSIIVGIRHDGYYDEKYFTLRHHQVRGNLRIKLQSLGASTLFALLTFICFEFSTNFLKEP